MFIQGSSLHRPGTNRAGHMECNWLSLYDGYWITTAMCEELLDCFQAAIALLFLIIVPQLRDNNALVLFTGMSLSPLEVIDQHAIDSSRLFASLSRSVTRRYYRDLL